MQEMSSQYVAYSAQSGSKLELWVDAEQEHISVLKWFN